MTNEDLWRFEALASKASPRPWRGEGIGGDECEIHSANGGRVCDVPDMGARHIHDADLIVAAVNALPALCASVREARAATFAAMHLADKWRAKAEEVVEVAKRATDMAERQEMEIAGLRRDNERLRDLARESTR